MTNFTTIRTSSQIGFALAVVTALLVANPAAAAPSAPGYTVLALKTGLQQPRGLVLGANNAVYGFEHHTGLVFRIGSDGVYSVVTTLSNSTWVGIAFDKSLNALFVEDYIAGKLQKVTLGSPVTVSDLGVSLNSEGMGGIASDGMGTIYASEFLGNISNCPAWVRKIDTNNPAAVVKVADQQVCYPDGPAVDAQGNLYIAERGGQMIRRVPVGSVNATPFVMGFNQPYNVSVRPGGGLLVPDAGDGKVYSVDIANPMKVELGAGFGQPYAAVEDGAKRIYVASFDTGTIWQLTPNCGADGSICDDGDPCTQTDTCLSGICTGANPVTCAASDQCHDSGTCDPATGLCSNPAKMDGTNCDDGDACTQADTCQAGACTGANPVACSASDQCHDAGTCDPATGKCSDPAKTDGTNCDDGNACTQADTCQAGACTGADPVTCANPNECETAVSCNSTTGACESTAKADGTECSQGSCLKGVCVAQCNVDADCPELFECTRFHQCQPLTEGPLDPVAACGCAIPGGLGSDLAGCLASLAAIGLLASRRGSTRARRNR